MHIDDHVALTLMPNARIHARVNPCAKLSKKKVLHVALRQEFQTVSTSSKPTPTEQ